MVRIPRQLLKMMRHRGQRGELIGPVGDFAAGVPADHVGPDGREVADLLLRRGGHMLSDLAQTVRHVLDARLASGPVLGRFERGAFPEEAGVGPEQDPGREEALLHDPRARRHRLAFHHLLPVGEVRGNPDRRAVDEERTSWRRVDVVLPREEAAI